LIRLPTCSGLRCFIVFLPFTELELLNPRGRGEHSARRASQP
jgi:hypothetical protein